MIGAGGIWPDKTIKYCFKDVESKAKLYELILRGMDKWYSAGLDESFKMVEVSDSECRDRRSDVLLVDYSAPVSEGGKGIRESDPKRRAVARQKSSADLRPQFNSEHHTRQT